MKKRLLAVGSIILMCILCIVCSRSFKGENEAEILVEGAQNTEANEMQTGEYENTIEANETQTGKNDNTLEAYKFAREMVPELKAYYIWFEMNSTEDIDYMEEISQYSMDAQVDGKNIEISYLVEVGEKRRDYSVTWQRFYVDKALTAVYWCDWEMQARTLEEWRNSDYYEWLVDWEDSDWYKEWLDNQK